MIFKLPVPLRAFSFKFYPFCTSSSHYAKLFFSSTAKSSTIATEPKIYSAATTASSEFRRVLFNSNAHVDNAAVDSEIPAAFHLNGNDFQAAFAPFQTTIDTDVAMSPLVRQLTSLTLQSRPAINKFNLHQARAFFAQSPNDTGSPEVQCGLLTVRMMWLNDHCSQSKHDYKAQRRLVELVATRRRFLRYLRRVSLERFYRLLDALSLPPNYLDAFEATCHLSQKKQNQLKTLKQKKAEKVEIKRRMKTKSKNQ